MKAKELFEKFRKWMKEEVVEKRVQNDEVGYNWVYKALEYDKELKTKDYQQFFDRKELNSEYKSRYEEKSPKSKKQYAWMQNEINIIYSFHKCFAMRNQTRLQYYRHDLSQKGKRTRAALNIALGRLKFLKEQSEDKK